MAGNAGLMLLCGGIWLGAWCDWPVRAGESLAQSAAGSQPQLLQNPDFESAGLQGWTCLTAGEAVGRVERDSDVAAGTNSHALKLSVVNPGARCGVSGQCVPTFLVEDAGWYDLVFHARTLPRENDRGFGLTLSLETEARGEVLARTTLPEVGGGWKAYSVALHSRAAGGPVRLVITMSEAGEIWLDQVSLRQRESKSNP